MWKLIGTFNQEKALDGAFSVIVETSSMVRLQLYYSHCGPHWHCSRADGVTSLLVMSWRGLITNCVRGLPYNIYTPAQGYSDIIYNLHIDGLYRYLASARCDTFPRYSVSPLSHSDHVTPCHRHTRSAGRIHATPHSLEPDEKITVALEIYF